jgi:hypothetical protein
MLGCICYTAMARAMMPLSQKLLLPRDFRAHLFARLLLVLFVYLAYGIIFMLYKES